MITRLGDVKMGLIRRWWRGPGGIPSTHLFVMQFFKAITAAAVIGSPLINISPVLAETELDYKQKAAGFLAQSLCSQRLNNHSSDFLAMKIKKFTKAYPEVPMHLYLQEPKVVRAASVLSLGLNSSCSAPDMKLAQTRKAFELLGQL